MIFERKSQQAAAESYLIGCEETRAAAADQSGVTPRSTATTRSPLRHCSAPQICDPHPHPRRSLLRCQQLRDALGLSIVMHRDSAAPFADLRLDDGDMLIVSSSSCKRCIRPGHTRDSMCYVVEDRIFTGDTLLIDGTGRTDLPTGATPMRSMTACSARSPNCRPRC